MADEQDEGLRKLLRQSREQDRIRHAREVEDQLKRSLAEVREQQAQLKQALIDAAINWLQQKWGDQACPYCHETQWQVGTPLEIQLSPEDVMSPAFPVMCGNCGQTTLVNAVLANILPEGMLPSDLPEEL